MLMKKKILFFLFLLLTLITTACENKVEKDDEETEEKIEEKVDKSFDLYKTFFYEKYDNNIYRVLITDVTNDKKDEMIAIEYNDTDKTYHVSIYTIKNNEVKLIYEQTGADFHAGGFIDLYLYESDGEKTFINGIDKMWQGYGDYGYEVFKLSNDGEKQVIETNVASGSPVEDSEYNKVFQSYKEKTTYSIELVVTNGPSGIDKGSEYKASVIFGEEVSDNTYNPEVEEYDRNQNKVGNTSANLQNEGHFTYQNSTIYYANLDGTKIYSMAKGTKNISTVYKSSNRISYLNVIGRYIYCNETNSGNVNVVKVDLITGESTILRRNVASGLYVDNKNIYFATDNAIYKMNLDGTNETKITDSAYSFFAINNNNLYYIDTDKEDKVMNLSDSSITNTEIVGYKAIFYGNRVFQNTQFGKSTFGVRPIDLQYISEVTNNTNVKKLTNTQTTSSFTVADNKLYYSKEASSDETNIYSSNLDGTDEKIVAEGADAVLMYDVEDDYIYYFHISSNVSTSSINLYRISKTSSDKTPEKISWMFK